MKTNKTTTVSVQEPTTALIPDKVEDRNSTLVPEVFWDPQDHSMVQNNGTALHDRRCM